MGKVFGRHRRQPPDVHPDLWRTSLQWVESRFGRRGATVLAACASIAVLLYTWGPRAVESYTALHTAYRAARPLDPTLSTDAINIGVAIFQGEKHDLEIFERLAASLDGHPTVRLVRVNNVPSTAVSDMPFDVASMEARVLDWIQTTGATAVIWGYESRLGEQRVLRLWLSRASYSAGLPILDGDDGLYRFLLNNWLAPSTFRLPTLQLNEGAELISAWIADLGKRLDVDEFKANWRQDPETRKQAISTFDRCRLSTSFNCELFWTAAANFELMANGPSGVAPPSIGGFDFARALGYPFGYKVITPPRDKGDFARLVQVQAGMLRETSYMGRTDATKQEALAILPSIQRWRFGLALETEISGFPALLDALSVYNGLSSYRWIERSTLDAEALKRESERLSRLAKSATKACGELGRAKGVPSLIRNTTQAAIAYRLAEIDRAKWDDGGGGDLRRQAIQLLDESIDGLRPLHGRLPRLRPYLAAEFFSQFLPEPSRLDGPQARAAIRILAKATEDLRPSLANGDLLADVASQLIVWRARALDDTSSMPCTIIGEWSRAERRRVDARRWTVSSTSPGAVTYLFSQYEKRNGADEAKRCLEEHEYDYGLFVKEKHPEIRP